VRVAAAERFAEKSAHGVARAPIPVAQPAPERLGGETPHHALAVAQARGAGAEQRPARRLAARIPGQPLERAAAKDRVAGLQIAHGGGPRLHVNSLSYRLRWGDSPDARATKTEPPSSFTGWTRTAISSIPGMQPVARSNVHP
jgi:hypothetical protein